MPVHIYHRLESPTQTRSHAQMQKSSGELWGRAPRGGNIAAAQAYVGPLPAKRNGIEFTCTVPIDPLPPPGQAFWRQQGRKNAGEVEIRGDFAIVKITVTKIRYRPPIRLASDA